MADKFKKFKKKYKDGGLILSAAQAGGKVNDFAFDFANDQFQNQTGLSNDEMNIVNRYSNKTKGLPLGIGSAIGAAGDIMNLLTGRTGQRLNDFRTQQAEDNFANIKEANKMSGYLDQSKVTFAMGGDLQEFEGPVHEEGGIQLTPEAEVEGGETKKGNYIFSDRLKVPGKKRKSFADLSKEIKKKYTGKRPNEPIDIKAEERELATLQDMQETVRGEIMSDAYMMAYGGFLKKKKKYFDGGDIEDLPGFVPPTTKVNPEDLGLFNNNIELGAAEELKLKAVDSANKAGGMYYVASNSVPSLAKKEIPDLLPSTLKTNSTLVGGNPNPVPTKYIKEDNMFGMQDADYFSAGAQSLAGFHQLSTGLQGSDEIPRAKLRLARPNKVNMTAAKRLASQEIDTASNAADASIRDTAPGAGSYLSNRIASGIKRARVKGETLAKLSQEEELQNASIMNNFNQFNAGVLNQEEQLNLAQRDKEIAEMDAARMAVTEGLNNIGQSVGQTTRDKRAYDWQKVLAKNWISTNNIGTDTKGNKYYKRPDGYFYIDGKPVPKELIG